jgi:hypothetical protein
MKLEPLARAELRYRQIDYVDFAPGGHYVGVMDGTLTGERLSGSLFLVNAPPKRPDDVNMPTLSGILTTGDGAKVFVQFNGIALRQEERRHFVTSVLMRSGDQRYAWVNRVFGVMEGILSQGDTAIADLYLCRPTIEPPAS